MASINEVRLAGNLGRDPEISEGNGRQLARISIATERYVDGQKPVTDWHDVVLFGRSAKYAEEYLRKGDFVIMDGHLQTSKWVDQETGKTRRNISIVGDKIQGVGLKNRAAVDELQSA